MSKDFHKFLRRNITAWYEFDFDDEEEYGFQYFLELCWQENLTEHVNNYYLVAGENKKKLKQNVEDLKNAYEYLKASGIGSMITIECPGNSDIVLDVVFGYQSHSERHPDTNERIRLTYLTIEVDQKIVYNSGKKKKKSL